jgi:hypothetical protein
MGDWMAGRLGSWVAWWLGGWVAGGLGECVAWWLNHWMTCRESLAKAL